MRLHFLRSLLVVCIVGVGGWAGASPAPLRVQTISLQQEADFGANDATLGQDAQHQLGQLVLLMRGKAVVKLTVRPFSGPMETKALALERGRSIKAALTLHGANPDIIVVDPGQAHEGRSGEVQLTVEHVQR